MRRSSLLGHWLSGLSLLALLALALSSPAHAAVIMVDSGTDDGVGCTLREAVEAANTDTAVGGCTAGDSVDDEIRFTDATGATVALTVGELSVTDDLIVSGPVTITAAANSRIFSISGGSDVTFADLTLTGGRRNGGAAAVLDTSSLTLNNGEVNDNRAGVVGGGIAVAAGASLTVNGTSFTGNIARGAAANEGGGAIYTDGGTVTVENATFTNNRATGSSGSGGALLNPNGATLDISFTSFNANRAQRAGGAIETVDGVTTVGQSTFDQNAVGTAPGNGGAIHGGGSVDITVANTGVNQNRATEGGAFWIGSAGSLTVIGSSFFDNIAVGASSDQGGGAIYVDGGTLTVLTFDPGPPSITSGLGTSTNDATAAGASNFFFNNRATGDAGSGGAVLINGGTATLTGSTMLNNRSQRAGGAIEVTAPIASASVSVTLTGVSLNGNSTGTSPGNGGGLHTTQGLITLDITDGSFASNDAASEGGGLWINTGTTLTLTGSSVTGNAARGTAADNGGGGLFVNGGDATVSTTTFGSNTALASAAGGGLLAVGGTTSVSESLFDQNDAGFGGAVASINGATVGVQNATLYGNTARFGGAVFSAGGSLSFDSATIASNSAAIGGGGLYNQNGPNLGVPFVTLANTIVADNAATNGPNLQGRHGSDGHNVIGTTPSASTFPATASDQTGTDPLLGPLQDNGGPTLTAALMAGSPAIDTGSTALTVDQRGVARTEPDDVGAVEFGDAVPPAMLITGVFDGPLTGGTPKAVEFYVLQDIADLSAYGFGSANNGGGTDGEEFTFPAGTATAGDYLYLASEATQFTTFFGFAPDYTSSSAVINGDDAIELFFNGAVGDVFGELNVIGTGQPWEYLDGWAYRTDATGPDGATFVIGNWSFSGINANDDDTSQGTATNPWPIGTYSPVLTTVAPTPTPVFEVAVDQLAVVPNPFGSRASATFALTEAQAVTVTLYDVMGRQVQQVFSGQAQAATPVTVSVDGASLASGVYVLVLQGETVRATSQVTVAR